MEASPDPSSSSRREGFRWSNVSGSSDMGFDGESIDTTENIDTESLDTPLYDSKDDQKCGLCGRLLRQKSPWSSYRIIRNGDMPVAGVLSCSHIFHAECLEQMTPKIQIHDPPCPTCLKTAGRAEASSSVSEPFGMALKAAGMGQEFNIGSDSAGNNTDLSSDPMESGLRRNQYLPMPRRGGSSLVKNHFKKQLPFKGKTGKDLFGAKAFRRAGSSSSNSHAGQNSIRCSKRGKPSQKQ